MNIIGFVLLLGVLVIPAAVLAGDTPLLCDCSKLANGRQMKYPC